jgi:hypothetical protein
MGRLRYLNWTFNLSNIGFLTEMGFGVRIHICRWCPSMPMQVSITWNKNEGS